VYSIYTINLLVHNILDLYLSVIISLQQTADVQLSIYSLSMSMMSLGWLAMTTDGAPRDRYWQRIYTVSIFYILFEKISYISPAYSPFRRVAKSKNLRKQHIS